MKKLLILTGAVATLAAAPLSADTIAYWSFGTNGFHDVSGNGHDLVGVEIAESDDGYIVFNGTNSFLKTAAALDLSGELQVTFECWARAADEEQSRHHPVERGAGDGGRIRPLQPKQ